jgi:hypothetical protein
MSRPIRRIVPLAATVMIALLGVPVVSGAASTKTCKISGSEARRLGPTYVTYAAGRPGYKVRSTSCASGKAVIRSFHGCRLEKGRKGRCTRNVRGYRCSDSRPSRLRGPNSFDGNVTCTSGSRRVMHSYTQNT